MKLKPSTSLAVLMTLCAFALGGCGSSNSGGSAAVALVPGTDVPVTATETTAGVISFANLSSASTDESAEPIALGDAALAASETDEPDSSV